MKEENLIEIFTDKNCIKFKHLNNLIFNGMYKEVDSFFEKYVNKESEKKLVKLIGQSFSFFSFKSMNNLVKTKEETFNRKYSIFKNLSTKSIIYLFSPLVIDKYDKDYILNYIDLIKKDLNKNPNLANDTYFLSIFTNLFNDEDFDILDKINNKLKFNILEKESEKIIYKYKEENSTGCSYLSYNDKCFKPYYDIIFNYTKEKENYLLKNKITLPNIDIVSKLEYKNITNEIIISNKNIYNQKIQEYKTILLNKKLNVELLDKKENIKRNKI